MPKASEFLNSLLNKAGLKPEDEVVKMLTAIAELNDIQIPDLVAHAIQNNLLSINDAKNNHPEIKNHNTSQAYDGLDKEINRFIEDYKLPDEVKTELLAEKSSVNRSTMLAANFKSLEEAKATCGRGEKDTLQQEINRLNNELRTEKDKEAAIRAEHKKEITQVQMNYHLGTLLGAYKTKFDELPANVKERTLREIINSSLATDSAELTVDEAGQLSLRKKDGANFFGEDNRPLDPKSYMDKIFARDKILVVNDQNQNNNSGNGANNSHNRNGQSYQRQNQNQNNGSGNNGNGNGKAANPVLASLAGEALKAFEGNGAQ
jgi:hypothetical protein